MICKKDVILWFKELESYKRIDTMCTLLNMCLPFELRFLGTCLEELGRRDSQELRGMELRVNSPQDLATDMVACQKGEPTDKKIRRKMALYLALIRACNRTCVTEIFRTLDGWGERDFLAMNDPDTLQELLLVYTMAANHPVFSFEQHMKCTEIFEKIKENKLVCDQSTPTQQQLFHAQHAEHHLMASVGGQHQQDLRQHLPPSHQELMQQHAMHAMHLGGQHPQLLTAAPIQVLPQVSIAMNFPQSHLTKLIPADGNIQHPIVVDSIPHMLSSNIIPADSNSILTHPNATWPMRPFPPQGPSIEHPPQSSSPMLSQQSSPSSSRTTSPNRAPNSNMMGQQGMQTQQLQGRNISQRITATMKGMRRPSSETTPPPMGQSQQQQLPHAQMGELILPQNMKHMDEVVMNNEVAGNQLQTLIRNGFTRAGHHPRLKAGNYMSPHHQQQQQQQQSMNQHFQALPAGNFSMNTALAYSMQNMSMADGGAHSTMEGGLMGMNSNKSAGSDSGSSIGSPGDISPSETPTLMSNPTTNVGGLRMSVEQQQKHHQQLSYNKQLNLMRLNGRSDKLLPVSVGGGSNVTTGSTIIYAPSSMVTNAHQQLTQQQSQQLFGGADIILAPGGNAGAANLMQTSMANNNNSGNIVVSNTNANVVSSNNNMTSNTVLISSPSAGGGGGILGNVITSNSVILQAPQQQYNTSYSYHAAAAAAAQHLASTSRPPMMTHNPGLAPPPGTFRLPGFQLPPNGELIYPAYHPAGITFLPGGAPPGAAPVALRSANSASVSSNTTSGVPPQLSQPPPQQMQATQGGVQGATLLTASPYSTLTVGVAAKPLSCYNCGSQTHSGRDCQEASMDDVTRSAVYKLDYSVSASSNPSPTTSSGSANLSLGGVGGGGGSDSLQLLQSTHHQKQHSMDSGVIVSTSAAPTSASVLTAAAVVGGTGNTK